MYFLEFTFQPGALDLPAHQRYYIEVASQLLIWTTPLFAGGPDTRAPNWQTGDTQLVNDALESLGGRVSQIYAKPSVSTEDHAAFNNEVGKLMSVARRAFPHCISLN